MRLRAALFLFSIPALAQIVTYSTYLRDHFTPTAIAADSTGNVYIAGNVSIDSLTSQVEPMVMKLDPPGQKILYSHILGGSIQDTAAGLALDQAGNAYIIGTAQSPDFPVTPGRTTGSLPAANTDARTFLVKLDPQGDVLFSETIGSVSNAGYAVAIAPQGQILMSGVSNAKGFASTNGAYSVPDTTGRPYLMELSADGSTVVFAATGIGGNSLALDSSGNIFLAGATSFTDYPTTSGAYQTKFNPVTICFGLCQISFPGTNQYVTKVDPAATKLLYSTGVTGTGSTSNKGLAVDSAGNAYVTGMLESGTYPFTVPPPSGVVSIQSFTTKLDRTGSKVIYSIPVGGAGVVLQGSNVLAGGSYNSIFYGIDVNLPLAGPPPGVTNLNPACQVNNLTTGSQSYVSELDSTTGQILSTVLVDSTNGMGAGIALASSGAVWLAGTASQADVPITPGAIAPAFLTPGVLPGAALAKIDFTQTPAPAAPQIGCLLDAATLWRLGPVAPNQLLTLMGTSLDNATISFDGQPASILYSSASQVNLAVPFPKTNENYTLMQLSTSAGSVSRQLPLALSEPSVFVNLAGSGCTVAGLSAFGLPAIASNQDGSMNSCSKPARSGSIVSLYLNGVGGEPNGSGGVIPVIPADTPVAVMFGDLSAEVVKVSPQNNWIWRVDVLVPPETGVADAIVTVLLGAPGDAIAAGPLSASLPTGSATAAGTPFPLSVWLGP